MIKFFTRLVFALALVSCNLLQLAYAQAELNSKSDLTKNTFKKDVRVVELLKKIDELVLDKNINSKINLQKENYAQVSDIKNEELRKFLGSGQYIKTDSFFNYENSYIVINNLIYENMQTDGSGLKKFSVYFLPKPSVCLDARYLQDAYKGMIFWPTHPPRYIPQGNTDEERALHQKKFIDFENNFNSRSILWLEKDYGDLFLADNLKACLIKIEVEVK